MRIKPILFNTDMVRAILDGRKTVTRRVIKPQPKSKLCYTFAGSDCGAWGYPSKTAHEFWGEEFKLPDDITEEELKKKWNPPYHADDILYVRETWQIIPCIECGQDENGCCYSKKVEYEDGNSITEGCFVFKEDYPCKDKINWRPSIHMPKEAARIWLKIKDVRVERLQEIDDEGVISEGLEIGAPFDELWDSTIKKSDLDRYGWEANPWVWVIEFERCEKPEGWK